MTRGFILQAGHRVERGRLVVELYGTLENGQSFRAETKRQRPHFWIRHTDAPRARSLLTTATFTDDRFRTLADESTTRLEFRSPSESSAAARRLRDAGVHGLESDIRPSTRWLIERGVRATIGIDGEESPGNGTDVVFLDPEIEPVDFTPDLSVLSLDIETDPRAERLLSVGLSGCGADEVLLFNPPGMDCPAGAIPFDDERSLLAGLVRRVRELDPDVLTGWNVIDFDLAVLARIARARGVRLSIGRGNEPLRLTDSTGPRGGRRAHLPGRVVLDGIDLLRGAFVRLERYSLQAASSEILGKGKTITASDRGEAILDAFHRDRAGFVEYNLRDAQLVLEILDELKLIELTVERCRLTGMTPDRVGASVASFDHLYLTELHRRGRVAPDARPDRDMSAQSGGHVLDPAPGLYRHVLMFDFRSLYPSLIRTFQIDPAGYLGRRDPAVPAPEDAVVAPNGAAFARAPGILPGLLDQLFPRRERARRDGDRTASQAIKILMNSFYGVLGTPACRFASRDLANAITGFGRELLLWSRGWIERRGHRVLYGDTDSLFVLSGAEEPDDAQRIGERLVRELNRALAEHIDSRWRVDSRLELEFETLYLRLLLPALKQGRGGARKRYAGLIDRGDRPEVVFTGLEAVRRDWTELARTVQRELYRRLFADEEVADYVRRIVREVRAGEHDGRLVYRRTLRRDLDSYTAATPPHVAAARRSKRPLGRRIAYVITEAGPEPLGETTAKPDREHYVQRQVRAVTEPVLTLIGLDFDQVVGDDRQLRLF